MTQRANILYFKAITVTAVSCIQQVQSDATTPGLWPHAYKRKILRQDPLEAILVTFGRRALFFLFENSWKKMKNDTTFVRMRSGDHLGDAKMSKTGTSLRRI